ncbi:hypothetical protein KJ781_03355 [Patescibacteria group bacterium]|nr:hypothetical protein [Patescibacteria group bacterium]MBU1448909.1 hypothetical protein [Patescibacteria group bacterium]MBU2612923.1 hypothetical protein [Patescibacteria group bacterium]
MSWKVWLLVSIGAVLVGLCEATFLTILPSPWREIHPVLSVAVIFVVLGRSRAGMAWAAIAGLMIDLYAVGPSSFSFARLLLTVALVSMLSLSILTNRSIYATVVLMLFGRGADWAIRRVTSAVSDALFHAYMPVESFRGLATSMAWDVALVAVTFVVIASFTKRFLVTAPHGYRGYDDI